MAKLSSDDIEGECKMAKRSKTNEGGKTLNIPSSQSKIKEGLCILHLRVKPRRKTLNPTSPQNETGEENKIATIHTDFLECSICFNLMYSPVNQVIYFSMLFSRNVYLSSSSLPNATKK